MVVFAESDDVPAIVHLWRQCFGDRAEYVENFIRMRFVPGNALLYKENGSLAAMLFLLDGAVRILGKVFSSKYVYAACTHPDFRRRGLMAELLTVAEDEMRRKNVDFLAIRPATPHLFDYYKKLGFQTAFEARETVLERSELESCAAFDAAAFPGVPAAKQITTLRDAVFSAGDYFVWDTQALEYAFAETLFSGGGNIFSGTHLLDGYALYSSENGCTFVKEFCCRQGTFPRIARLLLQSCESGRFVFLSPVNFCLPEGTSFTEKNAMLKALNAGAIDAGKSIQNAYLGLPLD